MNNQLPKKNTMRAMLTLCLLIGALAHAARPPAGQLPDSANLYLGLKLPGLTPEQFAANLMPSDGGYGGFVFTKQGDEVFFFAIDRRGRQTLMHSQLDDSVWTPPARATGFVSGNEVHPFFSPDDGMLVFGSDRQLQPDAKVPYFNLWSIERSASGWSEPRPLSATISTGFENCGSFDTSGTLYFRRVSPSTRGDIYQSVYAETGFSVPVKLPKEINTAYDESHPCIAPDGGFLIFSSKRPGGFNSGRDDLWISFRKTGGFWSEAMNMGEKINDGHNTSCATLSPDGKFLFFVRIENGVGVPYWISADIIKDMKPQE